MSISDFAITRLKLKKGCLLSIVITLVICLAVPLVMFCAYWFHHIHVPKRHIKKAVEITDRASVNVISVGDEGGSDFLSPHEYRAGETSSCKVVSLPELVIRLCVIPPKRNWVHLEIMDKKTGKTTELDVDIGGYALGEGDVDVTYSGDSIFAVWRNEKQGVYSINLTVIHRAGGKERVTRKVYEKGFGIHHISAGYSEQSKALLIAWNDWSYPSDEDLFLGRLDADQINRSAFTNSQILKEDRWDKAGPYFLVDGPDLYLAHSTGHHMGFFAHEGTVSIGVSKIGASLKPEAYRMIASVDVLPKILKIENGIVYYTRQDAELSKIVEVRKISFDEAYHPFGR